MWTSLFKLMNIRKLNFVGLSRRPLKIFRHRNKEIQIPTEVLKIWFLCLRACVWVFSSCEPVFGCGDCTYILDLNIGDVGSLYSKGQILWLHLEIRGRSRADLFGSAQLMLLVQMGPAGPQAGEMTGAVWLTEA